MSQVADMQGQRWTLDDWALVLRPVNDADGPRWLELVRSMSWATRFKRGSRRAEDLTPDDERRAVTPDRESEIVFVVVASRGEETKMVGITRARRTRPDAWEFAIVVLDDWQKTGIGFKLMDALIGALEERGGGHIEGEVLATNKNMLDFLLHLGFEAHTHDTNPQLMRVTRKLAPREAPNRPSAG